ncbi:ACP S-malonyltransferase [Vagococcus fessus]|uniref:Malonyl CoA-acyl carrier protein transacylase n=1 Tax=Vagococcus fessus TaxID=120370 RepID=A0A430ABY9_9ENTE|nr:ACP S-malonyltransferase [Vagococcus fessus]RSU04730.1 [acyl-carrier-protein] S-malonyltransferase [Vagococcus fessus]
MATAFVFSGQGSQYIGMGKELYDTYPIVQSVVDDASRILNIDMTKLCFEENNKLNETAYTQPAILTISVAIAKLLIEEFEIKPDYLAGLSLGEYSALVINGTLTFEEALCLVRKRGTFMEEAFPSGQGGMSAVMGLAAEEIESICKEITEEQRGLVKPANYNMPNQTVISGEIAALELAKERLTQAGARKIIPLNVSGPFHTALLEPAAQLLQNEFKPLTLKTGNYPVVANVTGEIISLDSDVKQLLVSQVKSPVLWQKSVETLYENGVEIFIEVGPGRSLSTFIRKTVKQVATFNVEDLKSLEKVRTNLTTEENRNV